MIGSIVILACLILLNGMLAASEIALISVNKNKVKAQADDGNKKAALLYKVIEEPSKFLSTIQIGISFIALFSGIFAAESFAEPIVGLLVAVGVKVSPSLLKSGIFLFITVVLTYFTLVFGELVPKRLGMKKPLELSLFAIKPLNLLSYIVTPFVKILALSTDGILKIFGLDGKHDGEDVTEEEIRLMVDVGSETGFIDHREHEMIHNIFEFDNNTAENIATHRIDVVALPLDASHDDIIKFIVEEKYSRIPIYRENLDDIIGVLHIKDIMEHVLTTGSIKGFDMKGRLRELYFVPFSKKVAELFLEMQRNQVYMAVVIDEYGGTVGIVTMEDIVEEIMGSILDEHDEKEIPDINKIDENIFIIKGITDLEIVDDYFEDISLPTDEYETLSGFIIGQLGHIPEEEEKPEIVYEGFLFKVNEIDEKRISSVLVCRQEDCSQNQ